MAATEKYRFTCSAEQAGAAYRLTLSGFIRREGKNAAAEVLAALEAAPADAKLQVRLRDFYGGDIDEGLSIYHDLRERNPEMVADGVVASMGTVILCAGDVRLGTRRLKLMMHRAKGTVEGDAEELTATAKRLAEVEDELAGILAERTGLAEEEVRAQLMPPGSDVWLTAEKAKAIGLLTGLAESSGVRTVAMQEVKKLHAPEEILGRFAACYEEQTERPGGAQTKPMKKEITAKLGLAEGADEAAVEAAIDKLVADKAAAETRFAEAEKRETDAVEAEVGRMLEAALKQNRVTPAQVAELKAEAKKAPQVALNLVKGLVGSLSEHKPITGNLGTTGGTAARSLSQLVAERSAQGWDYMRWAKEDSATLAKLRDQEPALFEEIKTTLK